MYFNAVVVEVKTFILLFRLALLKFVFRKIGCSLELNKIMIGNREKIKLLFFLLHTINFKVYLEKVIPLFDMYQ